MTTTTNDKTVLVTGGSGFVASHCIVQLLNQGYNVRTTLRSIHKKNEVIDMLKEAGINSTSRLGFFECDLTKDSNWDNATKTCDYVLHVASPIFLRAPKNEDEMVRPAVDGTVRILKASRDAGVKRVVITSNFGAVGYSHTDTTKIITEESWTDPNEKGLSIYNKSKVLAERAAWNFIKNEGSGLELSVINPMGIFGPSLSPVLSSGFELLQKLLNGSMKRIPNITLGIVDVRDVADLHIRAMISPAAKGQRFLALAGGILSLPEIAALIKKQLPEVSRHVSTKKIPDWIVKVGALFNPVAKSIVPMLSRYRNASNEKARQLLGWKPRTNDEAIIASVESMVKFGSVK